MVTMCYPRSLSEKIEDLKGLNDIHESIDKDLKRLLIERVNNFVLAIDLTKSLYTDTALHVFNMADTCREAGSYLNKLEKKEINKRTPCDEKKGYDFLKSIICMIFGIEVRDILGIQYYMTDKRCIEVTFTLKEDKRKPKDRLKFRVKFPDLRSVCFTQKSVRYLEFLDFNKYSADELYKKMLELQDILRCLRTSVTFVEKEERYYVNLSLLGEFPHNCLNNPSIFEKANKANEDEITRNDHVGIAPFCELGARVMNKLREMDDININKEVLK